MMLKALFTMSSTNSYETPCIYLIANQVEENVQTVNVYCNQCSKQLQDLVQKIELVNLVQLENQRTLEAIEEKLTKESERSCTWK